MVLNCLEKAKLAPLVATSVTTKSGEIDEVDLLIHG